MTKVITVVGVFWYSEEQWKAFRLQCEDGENLPHTYAACLKGMQNALRHIESRGQIPVRIEADIDEFLTWCRENGMPADAKGRNRFANIYARDYARSGKLGGLAH